ncbi:MAG: flavodoxin-dependent (E)-4-hydroxy-3-methylbut-2-enyl-diphosphate synthase, partial [Clostridia bacterium]|nr:flavodoxin-dependent (E)-4-hydroxy-3-methylbut-2-enyl-diphosphate synthase [Clostridia bacterium]
MFTNEQTVKVKVGNTFIGGGAPISVQSMLCIPAHDVKGNVEQALRLQAAGCDIVRVTVPDTEALQTVKALKEAIKIPLVADIHFDYRLALESVAMGVDKVRINPGNIGSDDKVKLVADACRNAGVPIRIGVNSGSLEKEILAKYGGVTPEAMVESGLYHISLLEKFDFTDIVLSLKSSDTFKMYKAYEIAAEKCKYPLHLGVTEAGTESMGVIKSAAGIGGLLLRGIGNTIRVSLTDDPVKEVEAGIKLLKAIGIRNDGIKFVSCPTCGRT